MVTAGKQIISAMRTFKDLGVQTDYVKVSGVYPADDYVYRIQLKSITGFVIKSNRKTDILYINPPTSKLPVLTLEKSKVYGPFALSP